MVMMIMMMMMVMMMMMTMMIMTPLLLLTMMMMLMMMIMMIKSGSRNKRLVAEIELERCSHPQVHEDLANSDYPKKKRCQCSIFWQRLSSKVCDAFSSMFQD